MWMDHSPCHEWGGNLSLWSVGISPAHLENDSSSISASFWLRGIWAKAFLKAENIGLDYWALRKESLCEALPSLSQARLHTSSQSLGQSINEGVGTESAVLGRLLHKTFPCVWSKKLDYLYSYPSSVLHLAVTFGMAAGPGGKH